MRIDYHHVKGYFLTYEEIITDVRHMDDTSLRYQDKAKGILRAEIKRRNMNYEQVAEKLAEMGVKDTAKNISNKIARGSFTAGFFVMCLEAIGAQTVRLTD